VVGGPSFFRESWKKTNYCGMRPMNANAGQAQTGLRPRARQLLLLTVAAAFIGGSIFLSQHIWRENGLRSLQAINEQRVQLVANAVQAEINRQDHLPLVLSLDSDMRGALLAAPTSARLEQLNRKLQRVSLEADTRALYIVRADGTVVMSDDWQSPTTLVGRKVADQPYFRNAMETGKSSDLGVDPEINRVRYYLAEAVRDGSTRLGVAVVRIEFDLLETAWERAGERVLVTDQNGVVFLSSDPVYKDRLMNVGSEAPPVQISSRYRPGTVPPPLAWDILEQRGTGSIVRASQPAGGPAFLYQSMALPEYGWTVHRLADLESVDEDQRDGAIIGGAISALILSLLLYIGQRHRAYVAARQAGSRLKLEVAERTRELRDANVSLQTEIDERRRTEARLRSAQNELVQAGKLAALGQMSAALAHEINQPLAAIRTFMASAKIFAQRGDIAQVTRNLGLISDLAERMAKITSHLKTFARKSEPGHPEPVRVDRAVEGALFLIESQIKSAAVEVEKDIEPRLLVSGYAVQLEQVIVNLIRNALDAVAGVPHPRIRIQVRGSADRVYISIADNGPGIPADVIERIFDPFVTTKPVGKGLGLGLSISYGIVQDFHGRIYAANRPEGGAELTVELPRLVQDLAPLVQANHA
jgi:two-component system C4-dicarboxylate transport sensor histidine kinase DctB